MIERLAFLRGTWAAETFELTFTARAGTILGTMRDTAGGRTIYYEFFYIAEADGTLVLDPHVMGERMARYDLARGRPQPERGAIFDNPAVPFPRTLFFEQEGERIRLAVEGEREGKPVRMEWVFARSEG
jgi:hypothetical protein